MKYSFSSIRIQPHKNFLNNEKRNNLNYFSPVFSSNNIIKLSYNNNKEKIFQNPINNLNKYNSTRNIKEKVKNYQSNSQLKNNIRIHSNRNNSNHKYNKFSEIQKMKLKIGIDIAKNKINQLKNCIKTDKNEENDDLIYLFNRNLNKDDISKINNITLSTFTNTTSRNNNSNMNYIYNSNYCDFNSERIITNNNYPLNCKYSINNYKITNYDNKNNYKDINEDYENYRQKTSEELSFLANQIIQSFKINNNQIQQNYNINNKKLKNNESDNNEDNNNKKINDNESYIEIPQIEDPFTSEKNEQDTFDLSKDSSSYNKKCLFQEYNQRLKNKKNIFQTIKNIVSDSSSNSDNNKTYLNRNNNIKIEKKDDFTQTDDIDCLKKIKYKNNFDKNINKHYLFESKEDEDIINQCYIFKKNHKQKELIISNKNMNKMNIIYFPYKNKKGMNPKFLAFNKKNSIENIKKSNTIYNNRNNE